MPLTSWDRLRRRNSSDNRAGMTQGETVAAAQEWAHSEATLGLLQRLLDNPCVEQLGVGPRASNIDEDAMTEFSVLTDESEMQFKENILDLRVSKVELDP